MRRLDYYGMVSFYLSTQNVKMSSLRNHSNKTKNITFIMERPQSLWDPGATDPELSLQSKFLAMNLFAKASLTKTAVPYL